MNVSLLATRLAGNSKLFWKKNGATVLTGVGVAGIPVAMFLTGVATAKTIEAMPKIKVAIQQTEASAWESNKSGGERDAKHERAVKKAVATMQVKMGLQVLKAYSPAIAVAGISMTCMVVSHGMMRKRETQLIGAFMALEGAFNVYRARVAEKIGEDQEMELYQRPGMKVVESDEGEACIINFGDAQPSIYGKFFDETCAGWSKNPEYNLMFLRNQQNWANDKLRAQGHLFLNEVYDTLGIPRTQAGQIVGWMANANEKGIGDGFVDFGIYQIADENNRAFVNGFEHTVGLDFNCDGVIIGTV